jgi:hypothetical protein
MVLRRHSSLVIKDCLELTALFAIVFGIDKIIV